MSRGYLSADKCTQTNLGLHDTVDKATKKQFKHERVIVLAYRFGMSTLDTRHMLTIIIYRLQVMLSSPKV